MLLECGTPIYELIIISITIKTVGYKNQRQLYVQTALLVTDLSPSISWAGLMTSKKLKFKKLTYQMCRHQWGYAITFH
jgi:hypothetical protein